MATPFVAGSAALVLSVRGKTAAVGKTLRTLFETTARRVPSTHTDGDPLQTVTQQGAGLINVYDAIHSTTVVSPSQLILNDTAHFQNSLVFIFLLIYYGNSQSWADKHSLFKTLVKLQRSTLSLMCLLELPSL